MGGDRPINADVPETAMPSPAPQESPEKAAAQASPDPAPARSGPEEPSRPAKQPARPARRRRPRVPAALKAVAGLVLVAVAFILAAVLGGSGGSGPSAPAGPAPVSAPAGNDGSAEAPASQTSASLGYPAFATNNTTRVGGADPASNAAAVSLAVFPSTVPAQRPAAVTLVGEEDWRAAIAAAVLTAPPLRAPVLFAGPSGIPGPTAEALEALDPQGAPASGGAAAFAIGDVATPDLSGKVRQVPASGGVAAAAAIARLRDRLFGDPPAHVVVAPAAEPAFAMPAAAWAARSGDPVLYSDRDKLPKATASALRRHTGVPIYVLGPSSAIDSSVVREIAKIDSRVKRVSGEDPVTNAIALARYADGGFGWSVNDPGHGFVVARSGEPLEAAAAAALSASGTWGPLLLTDSAATLPAPLREYFLDVKPGYTTDPTRAFYNHVWVIGDQEAIDVSQQAEIDELAELTKIGGEG